MGEEGHRMGDGKGEWKMKKNSTFQLKPNVALAIQNLSIAFGGLRAVDNLSLEIKKGEVFGLIGPNGAGKTTVFNCITQFYRPDSGTVILRTKDNQVVNLVGYPTHQIIRFGLVRTFQNLELIGDLTVLDNVMVGAHLHYKTGFVSHSLRLPWALKEEAKWREEAIKVLDLLGLTMYSSFPVAGLPYGIMKQVELARALISKPSFIILDEPAAGLNDSETEKLIDILKLIKKNFGATVLLVEHDMGLVMKVCDRICAINFGKLIAVGTPTEIQKHPQVQLAYLGKEVTP